LDPSTQYWQTMNESAAYEGRDLESMAFAVNYHRWILKIFEPFLGTRIVEVGAGTGSFSELLIERPIESLSLVEPSAAMHKILSERVAEFHGATLIKTYNSLFSKVASQIKTNQQPDSLVYVNVLEHIADDATELKTAYETLQKGGRIFVFVPAFGWLFGKIDRRIGHYRRYTTSEIRKKCQQARFKVIELKYMDFFGIAPWWIKYRLLNSTSMEASLVQFYDRYLVPVSRAIESAITAPAGKNIILIAEKP
jgi:SAM-dependent methyltransferase